MSQIALIGLPNVGKSTVFSSLTKQESQIGVFSFSTSEMVTGFGEVKDNRLKEAAVIENSAKIVYPKLQVYDIPLNPNKPLFTPNLFGKLREMDGFVLVLRDFDGNGIDWGEVPRSINEQIEKINVELIIVDLEILSTKEEKLLKQSKALAEKPRELKIVEKAINLLGEGSQLKDHKWESDEVSFFKDLSPLTLKPRVLLVNTEEQNINYEQPINNTSEWVVTSAKIEHEISLLPDLEQNELRKEYQMGKSLLDNLLSSIYKELNLISFFTIGDKESKAWTVLKGSKITEAAGKIHSDLQKGFIKAEIVSIVDFIDNQGWNGLKNSTKLRLEGKDYLVTDGDVVIIRFSK